MSINWNNIRPLNNSLNDGFEELICQLAEQEDLKTKKHFFRIGKPDGGKECYWELEDGSLIMWQAKYFTASLSTTQWSQIEKSIKTAIDSHPFLSKYYICLPIDRPDAKVKGQKSMLEKWMSKVKEWKIHSQTVLGKEIEIIYWGNFELVERLSKKEHEGLKYFWFNQEEFSDDWFDYKNEESINALGARYSKELNFELPIAKIFDGLSRDKDFKTQHDTKYNKLLENYRKIRIAIDNDTIKTLVKQLDEEIKKIRILYESIEFLNNDLISYDKLNCLLEELSTISSNIEDQLEELRDKQEKGKEKTDYYNRAYNHEISGIRNFGYELHELQSFYNGITCSLSNNPFLMIWGEAGCGKSHLLADIINKRKEKGQQSLLILGEHFSTKELPWTQILNNFLRKQNIDELTFLGALNAKAGSNQSRIIIFIDALNEGEGRDIWPKNLKSFIKSIKRYPWLGLVVSIRDSYFKLIAPEKEINLDLIQKIQHDGFADNEYEAVKLFFKYYDITLPSTPLLNPEFHNPLFLKLYCLSLHEQGLHEVPLGYEGITNIIDTFLSSINYKLSKPENLFFDENLNLVKQAVNDIILYTIDNEVDYVPYQEANKIINELFKDQCSKREPYLNRLISEGVFNKNLHWDEKGKYFDVIYLAYQRFQDHFTVSSLLEKYLNLDHPESSFKSGRLFEIVKDSRSLYRNQNLIEALSIQLPEKINKELFELIPSLKQYDLIAKAFIQSLIWRKVERISDEVSSYVNDVILYNDHLFDDFFETTLSVSVKPNFYFNAERIHSYLMQFSLSERDLTWTIWLQNKYKNEKYNISSIQRLIDWAWDEEELSYLSDDSILLTSTTLSWFLVSANRYLRDAATKALVCILKDRMHLLLVLLDNFKDVNDPYVLERLYAVSYGCTLHSVDKNSIKNLAEYVYNQIFMPKIVYPHILLRDYARGIIEYALYFNIEIKIDTKKVRPPYKSKKLPSRFPSNKAIDNKYEPKDDTGNYTGKLWGSTAILRSMTTEYGRGTGGYGDFGRYVFQRALDDWQVNYNGLSNYAIQRIFELGYDPKLFTDFDKRQGSGRHAGHNERIGKKYQWIVFYELLARVSDQFPLTDESDWDNPKSTILYDGPWYPYIRDIDPTIIIREKKSDKYEKYPPQWWFNRELVFGTSSKKEWIKDRNDIPKPENIIEVIDQLGENWIWLEIHPEWNEETPIGENKYDISYKRLWMEIQSYLLPKSDINKLKRNYTEIDRFPSTRSLYQIFSREYYWSPAFKFFNKPYYEGEDWSEITKNRYKNAITKVRRTTEFFNWEEEFDCSKEMAIQYYYPSQIIADGLNLNYSSNDAEFINDIGELICFDPSVNNKGISGLLIKKQPLLEWLDKNSLVLIWNVYGEKQIIGNYSRKEDHIGRLNISGLYTLDKDEKIRGRIAVEEE
ncbi:NACHT domain-containing protein [Dysgonomonas macrotermitis]|uniref:Uncharacterized protein n=1 Tax=Dysgonomonas macrotermitis TaxID=1346286 RepID=A0A1M4X9Q5_9BACT|nr:ATP-binding protein [Dysgonomonas macrotermitis]SHE90141.1 hypothetical protein SAMN05444362_102448 [Dysgonomonas macrotermitis]